MLERIKAFFREVKAETRKVVFPGKDELIGSTKVVIVSVILVSIFLGIVDMVLSKFIKYLLR
ncbi:preprotein translocase subunit SecE [bacterium BMS3Abin07]|nr:preprotein translocase subunit SecE [bacterium BMS3Abin07]GBE31568.1 preprotein translocase subunit SecE [bacterium BMS3Bbin05]HDO23121.1 preprotein translocase subunit SecE [Nitrospirota bacterium]HDZ88753.1 preprotein translocase subunit SecE [Nitrospirota bacterium]